MRIEAPRAVEPSESSSGLRQSGAKIRRSEFSSLHPRIDNPRLSRRRTKGFSVVAVLLVVVVLVAVGVGGYSLLSQGSAVPSVGQRVLDTDAIISQGTSDEPAAIDVDLGATSFAEFDSDLSSVEAELDAALSE